MRAMKTAALGATAMLVLSGCQAGAGSGPPSLAQLGVADRYSDTPTGAAPSPPADPTDWWRRFDDPVLDDLVNQGRIGNPDVLRTAATAGIARAYVALRAEQARIDTIRGYVTALQADQDVARFREEAKLVTARDALQANAESDRMAAAVPAIEARISADVARIAVLTGQAPAALRERLAPTAPIPTVPADVITGTPADLIDRSAVVRAAAARLARAGRWGRKPDAALADYKRAVLTTLEAAENARAAFTAAKARAAGLDKAVGEAEQVVMLARRQYREGLADYAALEQAERAFLAVRDERIDASANTATALIDLFVALAGGASTGIERADIDRADADGHRP